MAEVKQENRDFPDQIIVGHLDGDRRCEYVRADIAYGLLEGLRNAVEQLERLCGDRTSSGADAAIAKAEGGAALSQEGGE